MKQNGVKHNNILQISPLLKHLIIILIINYQGTAVLYYSNSGKH